MSARSYLYVPADRPDRLAKAPGRGADALIVDLEDGVAPSSKDDARRNLTAFLADAPGAEIWVRVNTGERLAADVEAVLGPAVRGIVLPKAGPDAVAALAALLDRHEVPTTSIVPLVETAAGVLAAAELASGPRVIRLSLGEADLCAELAVEPSGDERELTSIRTQVVLASAASHIDPPNGPVSTDFRDLDTFRASTDALRRLGFGSRSAIHPAQVEVINEVFTPTADDVARARRLLELFDAAGGGACTDDDGRMVDEAVVRSARRTLERAGQSGR